MQGMGTTIVVTTILGNYVYTANVGDSRLYLYDGELRQVTRDHSLVEEMVRLGELSEEQAKNHPDRHIITRALGAAESVDPDFFDFRLHPENKLLMCSDGLTNMVDDDEIRQVMEQPISAEEMAGTLVGTANDTGGMDNNAVIIIEPDADEEE